jgi:hypothetical protein
MHILKIGDVSPCASDQPKVHLIENSDMTDSVAHMVTLENITRAMFS